MVSIVYVLLVHKQNIKDGYHLHPRTTYGWGWRHAAVKGIKKSKISWSYLSLFIIYQCSIILSLELIWGIIEQNTGFVELARNWWFFFIFTSPNRSPKFPWNSFFSKFLQNRDRNGFYIKMMNTHERIYKKKSHVQVQLVGGGGGERGLSDTTTSSWKICHSIHAWKVCQFTWTLVAIKNFQLLANGIFFTFDGSSQLLPPQSDN